MSPIVFRLKFIGGPQDGLCVYSTHVPDTRMVFPFSTNVNKGPIVAYSRVADTKGAVYECERTTLVGQLPNSIPLLHYYFRAVTLPVTGSVDDKVTWSRFTAPVIRFMLRLKVGCRRWLLAPVSYPLQASHHEAPRYTGNF